MNNVSPLRFFGSALLFVSSQDPSLPPASHLCDTLYLGPSPILCLFVTGCPRTPQLCLSTGHIHVGSQPPETLSRSPKTLPAPEVSGQLVLG